MGLGKLDIRVCKAETRSLFLALYRNQFKMDQRLGIKPEMLELLKKGRRGSTLEALGTGTLTAREIIAVIDKYHCVKLTSFCIAWKATNRVKTQNTKGEEICASCPFNRE